MPLPPQVQINATTNEWEISTDGGKNWKSTGIKATGEKGDRGDAVFVENGVDYTSDPDMSYSLWLTERPS